MENAAFWRGFREWGERLPDSVQADLDSTSFRYVVRGASKTILSWLTHFSKQASRKLGYRTSGDAVQVFLHLLPPTNSDDGISITPLGEVIARFCSEQEECLTTGPIMPTPDATPKVVGDGLSKAQAAEKNREWKARLCIIQAFQLLGVPHDQWPERVREYYEKPDQRPAYYQQIAPPRFQPPPFDMLNQLPEDWRKDADREWEQHRDRFLKNCDWRNHDIGEAISTGKRTRGSGKKGRNAPLAVRYEWAARWILGSGWSEIAGDSFKTDQVRKAATAILEEAGWLTQRRQKKAILQLQTHQKLPPDGKGPHRPQFGA